MSLAQETIDYIERHHEEFMNLLTEFARIPAPSNHEEKRVAFCEDWLKKNGVENAYIDDALNVVCPFGNCQEGNPVTVFMAHSDVVFPDTETLPLEIKNGRIYCPGIGDDSVHAVHLLMIARYICKQNLKPQKGGVLIVINTGEEGLGNLRGSRKIVDTFGNQISEFYSLDTCNGAISNNAVGSKRYHVEIQTEGGHSYVKFGNRNAIAYLASLINTLYTVKVPEGGKTTYNVGTIQGGTSVNTIAQQAEMLYEFRSNESESLKIMDNHFQAAIECYRAKGISVNVKTVGERPCSKGVDPAREQVLMDKATVLNRTYFNTEAFFRASSTDCNIPLSRGIPAISIGCFFGAGAHTREEYVEIDSLLPGQKLAFDLVLDYMKK